MSSDPNQQAPAAIVVRGALGGIAGNGQKPRVSGTSQLFPAAHDIFVSSGTGDVLGSQFPRCQIADHQARSIEVHEHYLL
jgi:hypothetical protein